jgi:hypothetical protein
VAQKRKRQPTKRPSRRVSGASSSLRHATDAEFNASADRVFAKRGRLMKRLAKR